MLDSVEAVVEAVGGAAEAARLAGVRPSAVSNWKARGRIASEKAMIFSDALAKIGLRADPAVFGMASARPDEVSA